jgi:ubiquinone/menaquinone biosynthesis C-methylase UbiE
MTDYAEIRKAQTGAVFNRLAQEYDQGPGCFSHFGRRLVELAEVQPGQRVLDLATGRGAVLPAAERVGRRGEALGIDLAEGMVQAANEEIGRRGLQARALVMDAERLELPDGAFDRVLCGFGLMFFPKRDQALAEMRRVLRPGGRLAVSTWQTSQAADLSAALHALDPTFAGEPGWITEAGVLADCLTQAGLQGVRVCEETEVFRYASLDQYWQTARGTGLRRWLDQLEPCQAERLRASLTERLGVSQPEVQLHLAATALIAIAER